MRRRQFVRGVLAAGIAPGALLGQQSPAENPAPPPPAPVPWTLGLNPKTPLPATEVAEGIAEADAGFFNPSQMAALTRLCELLLPPMGEKPGAVGAGTPAFLDFLIGVSPKARKKVYSGGLDWLNDEARAKFKLPFAELNAVQADAMVRPWLRTWIGDHPPTEAHADFINIAHEDIRTATMNSKAWDDAGAAAGQDWVTGGLYWSPIEPDLRALNHEQPHVQAAPKAAHTMPEYPR